MVANHVEIHIGLLSRKWLQFPSSEWWVSGQRDMASVRRSYHIIIILILHPLFAITCFFLFLKGSSKKKLCSQKGFKNRSCWYIILCHISLHLSKFFTNLQRPATPKKPTSSASISWKKQGFSIFNSVPFHTPTMLLYFRCKLYPCHLLHHISDNQPIAYSHVIRLLSSLRNTACLGFQGHTQQITSKVREDWETSARFFRMEPSL